MWLWAHADYFGFMSGIFPQKTLAFRVYSRVNRGHGLVVGGGLVLAGLGLNVWDVAQLSPAELPPMTLVALGVQTFFATLFQGLLCFSTDIEEPTVERAIEEQEGQKTLFHKVK
jgi:hypothetical protein